MSQQFGRDGVSLAADVTLQTAGTETAGLTGNALTPPFNTFKALISACVQLVTGGSTTTVQIRIRRNPNQENVVVATMPPVQVTAGNTLSINFSATDSPGDPRSVQYQIGVIQNGAAATGLIKAGTCLDVTLISG